MKVLWGASCATTHQGQSSGGKPHITRRGSVLSGEVGDCAVLRIAQKTVPTVGCGTAANLAGKVSAQQVAAAELLIGVSVEGGLGHHHSVSCSVPG